MVTEFQVSRHTIQEAPRVAEHLGPGWATGHGAAVSPLLVVLEDLQWADPFTVDLISAVARSRMPAKLMLLGTYRQVDVAVSGHPMRALKPDLLIHHLCREIALEPLGKVA
jgi:predicted ATPase